MNPAYPLRRAGNLLMLSPGLGSTVSEQAIGLVDGASLFAPVSTEVGEKGFVTRFRLRQGDRVLADTPTAPGGAEGTVELPADERQAYRMTFEVENQASWARLSTRTRTDWTFSSARTGGPEDVPLLTLGYDLDLDLRNRLTGRRHGSVPVGITVGQVGGARAPGADVTFAVSYDDGRHWQHLRVRRAGGGRHLVELPGRPPRDARYVSFRVRATAAGGGKRRAGDHPGRGAAVPLAVGQPRAWTRSFQRSSTCSMPTDRRIRLSRDLGGFRGPAAAAFEHRLEAAEAGRVDPEPDPFADLGGGRCSAVDLDGEHRAVPLELFGRAPVAGVGRQPGVADPADPRVLGQPFGEDAGAALGALQPQVEGADPAQREPGLHRARDPAALGTLGRQRGIGAVGCGDGDSELYVGVPGEELRRRVHHDLRAEPQRLLQQGSGEGVVDGNECARLPAGGAERGRSATSIAGLLGDSSQSRSAPGSAAITASVSVRSTRSTCQRPTRAGMPL